MGLTSSKCWFKATNPLDRRFTTYAKLTRELSVPGFPSYHSGMPDLHSYYNRPIPARPAPEGFWQYEGLLLADGDAFQRDDLLNVGRVNGYLLTADTLKNWRKWRLVPAPTAGRPHHH